MKLGLMWGYWGALPPPDVIGVTQEAERLGFDSVWSAEAWGSDAFSPLAWIAGHTSTIKLGTGVVPLAARPPRPPPHAARLGPPPHRPHPHRSLPSGARRVGPPGRRGVLRPPPKQAAGPHP